MINTSYIFSGDLWRFRYEVITFRTFTVQHYIILYICNTFRSTVLLFYFKLLPSTEIISLSASLILCFHCLCEVPWFHSCLFLYYESHAWNPNNLFSEFMKTLILLFCECYFINFNCFNTFLAYFLVLLSYFNF